MADENGMAPIASSAPVTPNGLREILGATSGGGAASWEHVGKYLAERYINSENEKARRSIARKRDELYEGGGDKHIEDLLDAAFKDDFVKEQRAALISWAKWNNVIFRVVNEKATVYAEPANRRITNGDEAYQDFLEQLQIDATMREVNRKLVLHEDVWVQYRVRWTPRGRAPAIDVISPASFWAVPHPKDKTLLVAIILDQTTGDAQYDSTAASYRVWTDVETFQLDGACRVMEHTVEPWPLGRMPGVLATTRLPTTKGCLLAPAPAADLVAAHECVWFQNLLLLKESKSANRQNYASGDLSAAAMGQSADSETDVVLPEGVQIQTVDRGTDLAQFRDTASAVFDDVGANHGVPPSVRRHADASSGAEIHLRRLPLHELRRQQIPVMRVVEREVHVIMSGVNGLADRDGNVELAEGAFDMEGWGIDYGEIQQPLTASESDQVFETRRRLGLTDTVEEKLQRNPDLKTPEAAEQELELHTTRETKRVAQQKTLMALNGSTSTPNDQATAQQNGAAGRAAGDAA